MRRLRLVVLPLLSFTSRVLPVLAAPTTVPASAPATTQPVRIAELIDRLGADDFRTRDAAQAELSRLGEDALPALLNRLADPDPEIARRVAEILPVPKDLDRRADLAVRLIESGQRENLRQAILILFDDPDEMHPHFKRAVSGRTGLVAAVSVPILDELDSWHRQQESYRQSVARHQQTNPEGVARLRKSHEDTPPYLAEAAYWMALDARDDYFSRLATTQPAARETEAPRR